MTNPKKTCCGPAKTETGCQPIKRRDFIQRAALLAGGAGVLGTTAMADVLAQDKASAALAGLDQGELEQALRQAGRISSSASKYATAIARDFNGPYAGANLNRVAFPLGGIGAGMFCVEGSGAISHMSVRNRMEFFHEPCSFAAICIKGDNNGTQPDIARVLEGPAPEWKYFGGANTGNGNPGASYGFPRFEQAAFLARFPFATIELKDKAIPLDVSLTAWSPFTPGQADDSSLPVGSMEYTFHNPTASSVDAVFSFNSKNFMQPELESVYRDNRLHGIAAFPGGFQLWCDDNPKDAGSFAFFVDSNDVVVDHSWFRGGWWDALTLAWRNVQQGVPMHNPATEHGASGASLFVPLKLAPGETRVIRLMSAWYAGNTNLRIGMNNRTSARSDSSQQHLSGFLGKRLLNSFDPYGDGTLGGLVSRPFPIKERYIHFLIAGGSKEKKTVLQLMVNGEVRHASSGDNNDRLQWKSWDVSVLRQQGGMILILDLSDEPGGHICVDNIIFSDQPIETLKMANSNELKTNQPYTLFEDFESRLADKWYGGTPYSDDPVSEPFHRPWYTSRFENVGDVAAYWKHNYHSLYQRSAAFRDAFYDTTLPREVVEAVAANLTILKSPTMLRQADGRLWCWEGCSDDSGCCHGSCTHVWNYAQALPHLFPDLERSLRETEFNEMFLPDGKQSYRVNLPIAIGSLQLSAADGQLGGILKMYREWRVSGDTHWLQGYWPKIRLALDFMIKTWDPRETGLPEEGHHNTYDISFYGPNGHCGSFYVAALTAAVKMGEALNDDTSRYLLLRNKGVKRLQDELFNGEYFYQQIMEDGLDRPPARLNPDENGPGYHSTIERLNTQGPKYQYGSGCLSDGILGLWMARVCGIDDLIIDKSKVQSHLRSVHKYNLKHDLSTHANPQRPVYAMGNDGGLLLCSWPHGGAQEIPFIYSDEVWTGIEYQVASHLMFEGLVDEGLDIVRTCRDRYDGVRRNPFNEYECGHWYARAMSSYGLLQGLTGVRYDAVDKTLYVDSKVGDFKSFLSTASGFGSVEFKHGQVSLSVVSGSIDVRHTVVANNQNSG